MVYVKDNIVKPFTIAEKIWSFEGVVVLWCNLTLALTMILALTLQPEQSAGVGSIPSRAPPFERHDTGLQTRLALS